MLNKGDLSFLVWAGIIKSTEGPNRRKWQRANSVFSNGDVHIILLLDIRTPYSWTLDCRIELYHQLLSVSSLQADCEIHELYNYMNQFL